MAACPRCGSFLVAGTTCEFCARYGAPFPPATQPWQPPQWTPAPPSSYPPPAYQTGEVIDTGISPLELSWARSRVTWAWVLVGLIGLLSVGLYWLLTHHPELVGEFLLSFLLAPSQSSPNDQKTAFDILQLIVGFVLAWLPFGGLALHGMGLSQSSLTQLANLSPMLWEGLIYIGLALLIWRRSTLALLLATLLFLADSGIFGWGLYQLFHALWEQYQKYQDLIQQYPELANSNSSNDFGHWPWILIVPVVIRLALLWFFATSLGAVRLAGLHHRRLRQARREAAARAA